MLDLTKVPEGFLEPAGRVVEAAIDASTELSPKHVMVVGAWCRDVLHYALGHSFPTAATSDLDLAVALASWEAYRALSAYFPKVGNTGLRYRIAGFDVDLLPFGAIEDPTGVVEPPTRNDSISVWAIEEVFAASLSLALLPGLEVRLPTVAGFAAAKLGAWLDRSEWGETKDAADLALILHWYAESADVQDRLYDTPTGNAILVNEGADLAVGAAHLLGTDVAELIGPERLSELHSRWPDNPDLLAHNLDLRGGRPWPTDLTRRLDLLDGLARGLFTPPEVDGDDTDTAQPRPR